MYSLVLANLIRKISVICDNGKEIVVDKLIRKENNKTSVLENVKHSIF